MPNTIRDGYGDTVTVGMVPGGQSIAGLRVSGGTFLSIASALPAFDLPGSAFFRLMVSVSSAALSAAALARSFAVGVPVAVTGITALGRARTGDVQAGADAQAIAGVGRARTGTINVPVDVIGISGATAAVGAAREFAVDVPVTVTGHSAVGKPRVGESSVPVAASALAATAKARTGGISVGVDVVGVSDSTSGFDADAQAYIDAVEAADGQALEPAVVDAVDAFVKGCKADASGVTGLSNWDQIKLFAPGFIGRTLDGGLVMMKGTLVSNNGPFVSADYSRTLGLIGNETDNLVFDRTTTDDPIDNNHMTIFCTENLESGSSTQTWYGNHNQSSGDYTGIISVGTTFFVRVKGVQTNTGQFLDKFCGYSQDTSGSQASNNGSEFSVSGGSTEIITEPIKAFYPDDIRGMSSRMVCMSAGGSVDLTAYRQRVTQLVTDIQAAIP